MPAIITAGLVSFVSCVWTVARYPTAAFYLSPFRAWEFLIGSLLAVRAVPLLRNALLREAAGAAGLAMIMWAVITYSESSGSLAFARCRHVSDLPSSSIPEIRIPPPLAARWDGSRSSSSA